MSVDVVALDTPRQLPNAGGLMNFKLVSITPHCPQAIKMIVPNPASGAKHSTHPFYTSRILVRAHSPYQTR